LTATDLNTPFKPYIFPNKRAINPTGVFGIKKELNLLKRVPYNKVCYYPASHVESNWKQKLGIK